MMTANALSTRFACPFANRILVPELTVSGGGALPAERLPELLLSEHIENGVLESPVQSLLIAFRAPDLAVVRPLPGDLALPARSVAHVNDDLECHARRELGIHVRLLFEVQLVQRDCEGGRRGSRSGIAGPLENALKGTLDVGH